MRRTPFPHTPGGYPAMPLEGGRFRAERARAQRYPADAWLRRAIAGSKSVRRQGTR